MVELEDAAEYYAIERYIFFNMVAIRIVLYESEWCAARLEHVHKMSMVKMQILFDKEKCWCQKKTIDGAKGDVMAAPGWEARGLWWWGSALENQGLQIIVFHHS